MSASVPPYVSTLSKYPVKESAFFRGGPVFVDGAVSDSFRFHDIRLAFGDVETRFSPCQA